MLLAVVYQEKGLLDLCICYVIGWSCYNNNNNVFI